MEPLLTAAESRLADAYTIKTLKVPSRRLMENAATAVVRLMREILADKKKPGVILAGTGNNGGDAFAVARLLKEAGYHALTVYLLGAPENLSEDARVQYDQWTAGGGNVLQFSDGFAPGFKQARWAVDGIFGTGLAREVSGVHRVAIETLNARSFEEVFAVDIPSGLNADTGKVMGVAVRATHTITFGFMKRGLVTGDAAEYCGKVHCDSIGMARDIPGLAPSAFHFQKEDAKKTLPPRYKAGHKGTYGHVYVWVGEKATEGAAGLAAVAAYRSGCGLVTLVGTHSMESLRARLPLELMAKEVDESFHSSLSENDTLVVGPGLGTTDTAWNVLLSSLHSKARLVLDADALNLMAAHAKEARELLKNRKAPAVLTPHPKEASRLLGCDLEAVNADRYEAVRKLAGRYQVPSILKGSGTLIASPGRPVLVVTGGNSALSKGGTGDLLCGILAALLAQGGDTQSLGALAVYAHGRSAERLSSRMGTERAALAGEFSEELKAVWAELE